MVSRDPGAPTGRGAKEIVLLLGFVACLIIGIVTIVLPELSSGDEEHKASKSPASSPRKP